MSNKRSFNYYYTWLKGNTLKIGNLEQKRVIPETINTLNRLIGKFKYEEINIDLSEVKSVYALPTVPIVGYIDYFRQKGIKVNIEGHSGYLKRIGIESPFIPTENNCTLRTSNLDKIWRFENADEVHLLVSGIVASIKKKIVCEKGVIESLIWGLNEIMDNVIQHSEIKRGFIMVQVLKESQDINICIFDYGIGIYKSLKNTIHAPKNANDAIAKSIEKGVTRDKKIGQGNGMWGLYSIVNQNEGSLSIISGKGGLVFQNQGVISLNDIVLLNQQNEATTITFHLHLNNEVSITDIFGGAAPIDYQTENLENNFGGIDYKISKISSGTGTRESGLAVRNELINLFKQANKSILIDFTDVGLISSSFADEAIAKLLLEFGFYQFQTIFKLKGMNKTIQVILNKAIRERYNDVNNDNN